MFPFSLSPKLFPLLLIAVPGLGISSAFFGGKQMKKKKSLEELVCLLRKKSQDERTCYYELESVKRGMSIGLPKLTLFSVLITQ